MSITRRLLSLAYGKRYIAIVAKYANIQLRIHRHAAIISVLYEYEKYNFRSSQKQTEKYNIITLCAMFIRTQWDSKESLPSPSGIVLNSEVHFKGHGNRKLSGIEKYYFGKFTARSVTVNYPNL